MNEPRDHIAKKIYWEKRIPDLATNIKMMDNTIKSSKINPERLNQSKRFIEHKRLQQIISMYSGGESLDSCKEVFVTNIHNIIECWRKQESYVELLWYISLSVLFNLSSNEKQMLYGIIPQELKVDMLIAFIASNGEVQDIKSKIFAMRNPYERLESIICRNESNPIDCLKKYLNIWYSGHKGMEWHDSHKYGDQFFGYWSFETAAISKLLGIDDSLLYGEKYYPYDLAHYK